MAFNFLNALLGCFETLDREFFGLFTFELDSWQRSCKKESNLVTLGLVALYGCLEVFVFKLTFIPNDSKFIGRIIISGCETGFNKPNAVPPSGSSSASTSIFSSESSSSDDMREYSGVGVELLSRDIISKLRFGVPCLVSAFQWFVIVGILSLLACPLEQVIHFVI